MNEAISRCYQCVPEAYISNKIHHRQVVLSHHWHKLCPYNKYFYLLSLVVFWFTYIYKAVIVN